KDGITKRDVANYYDAVAEPLMRALRDRPVALVHHPKGLGGPSWFRQNVDGAEAWMHIVDTPSEKRVVRHLVPDSRDALKWLAQRRGRLYFDCLQNGYAKTIVAPYSLRAAAGAPVSAPLDWSEVTARFDPSSISLRTLPRRLDERGDLFAPALERGVRLPRIG